MNNNYIELRNRNYFGDIINVYFQFLKQNYKHYTSLYLRYNGVSIVLALVASYLLVSGFMGLASRDFRFGMGDSVNNESYLISGGVILLLIIFVTTLINYSFSSSYIASYVEQEAQPESRLIWKRIRESFGTIFIFIMLGAALYVAYIIISVVLTIIPFLGFIAQYGLSFILSAIFGLSFMSIFYGRKSTGDAFSEGWDLTMSNFWKVLLYSVVIGILNVMITTLILAIPGFIIGIYVYFSIESQIEIMNSVFANLLFTLGFAMFILAFIYAQALTQLAYGILYFNLHEYRYNIRLREKIDQIGIND